MLLMSDQLLIESLLQQSIALSFKMLNDDTFKAAYEALKEKHSGEIKSLLKTKRGSEIFSKATESKVSVFKSNFFTIDDYYNFHGDNEFIVLISHGKEPNLWVVISRIETPESLAR